MRSRKFASRNEHPLRRGGHAAIVQTSRRGAASHVPSHKQKPQGRTGGALKRSKKQLIRNGCHRPFSDAREIRATPRNSASRFRPNNQRPDLLECIAADAARRWSPPTHRRTAKPSTSATGDMPDVLPEVDALELAQLESLQDATHQKTQTVLFQHVPYARRQQTGLLRVVIVKARCPALLRGNLADASTPVARQDLKPAAATSTAT